MSEKLSSKNIEQDLKSKAEVYEVSLDEELINPETAQITVDLEYTNPDDVIKVLNFEYDYDKDYLEKNNDPEYPDELTRIAFQKERTQRAYELLKYPENKGKTISDMLDEMYEKRSKNFHKMDSNSPLYEEFADKLSWIQLAINKALYGEKKVKSGNKSPWEVINNQELLDKLNSDVQQRKELVLQSKTIRNELELAESEEEVSFLALLGISSLHNEIKYYSSRIDDLRDQAGRQIKEIEEYIVDAEQEQKEATDISAKITAAERKNRLKRSVDAGKRLIDKYFIIKS